MCAPVPSVINSHFFVTVHFHILAFLKNRQLLAYLSGYNKRACLKRGKTKMINLLMVLNS